MKHIRGKCQFDAKNRSVSHNVELALAAEEAVGLRWVLVFGFWILDLVNGLKNYSK